VHADWTNGPVVATEARVSTTGASVAWTDVEVVTTGGAVIHDRRCRHPRPAVPSS
jgi:hypothetical protein